MKKFYLQQVKDFSIDSYKKYQNAKIMFSINMIIFIDNNFIDREILLIIII